MAAVRIEASVLQEICHHAQAHAPLECCGLLSGDSDVITKAHPFRNVLRSSVRFEMDPRDLFHFFKELRSSNSRHLGIYHSHPASEAYPSETDISESYYPDCSYFIISLRGSESPKARAFLIKAAAVEELEILTIES